MNKAKDSDYQTIIADKDAEIKRLRSALKKLEDFYYNKDTLLSIVTRNVIRDVINTK